MMQHNSNPGITIIILTWNGLSYTKACLQSLYLHTSLGNVQVCVVDNGSTDGTVAYLRQIDWITLVENKKNLGFVKGNNVGINVAIPQNDVLLLNNDIVIEQNGWLQTIQEAVYADEQTGIAGCRLILADGRLLHTGVYMPTDTWWGQQIGSLEKDVNQYSLIREVQSVVGACMYIKRSVLDAIGGLNEKFFSYFEDTDYCLQAKEAGFNTICVGTVTLIHHENVSTRVNGVNFSKMFKKSQKIFKRMWEEKLMKRYETGVFWHSQVGSSSGYAVSSREMVLQLDEAEVDVRLAYLFGTDWMDTQHDDHRLAAMRHRPKDMNFPQVVYGSGDLFCKNSGKYRIGYTMLEVDGIPADWIAQANALDEIWVPSSFNKETFLNSGVQVPVHVMPLGVNPNYFNPQIKAFRPSTRYTFLSVFEWGERKTPETLLRAYHQAFSKIDNVLLLLKVVNTDPGVDVRRQIASLQLPEDGPPVVLLYNQDILAHQMGSLYRSADCFVLPTRGEGWGMPVLEAMACELPVIATDWSAHTDFMTEEIAYPIRVKEMVAAKAKCPYYEGFSWAQADEEHLIELMRFVYKNQEIAAAKGKKASNEALNHWTWFHAAQKIKKQLLNIGSV